jgi:effector-binding domain-containing protein
MGLSLDQIARLLDDELSPEQIRGMLKIKRAELKQALEDGQARLKRVEAWLAQFEQEDNMPEIEVSVKRVEPFKVAAIRATAPTIPAMLGLLHEVADYVKSQGVKPSGPDLIAFYHTGFRTENLEVEAMIPVEAPLKGNARVKVYELPAVEQMACYMHRGSYDNLRQAYSNFATWLEQNRYQITGPGREIYVQHEPGGENHLTELQFPVKQF